MAKFLTLNTHSWLEANSLKKLFDLAETIYSENYDVICLQEINQGDHTIIEDIDGWEGNKQSLKVDHVFTSKGIDILSSTVTFDGGEAPIVSDHFGLAVELNY